MTFCVNISSLSIWYFRFACEFQNPIWLSWVCKIHSVFISSSRQSVTINFEGKVTRLKNKRLCLNWLENNCKTWCIEKVDEYAAEESAKKLMSIWFESTAAKCILNSAQISNQLTINMLPKWYSVRLAEIFHGIWSSVEFCVADYMSLSKTSIVGNFAKIELVLISCIAYEKIDRLK